MSENTPSTLQRFREEAKRYKEQFASPVDSIGPNLSDLADAVVLCHNHELLMPTLMLVYGGIDVLGGLEAEPGQNTREDFIRWAEKYLIVDERLPCTGMDLYGARCGILHSFTSESSRSRAGEARRIHYAWGTGASKTLRKAGKAIGQEQVVLHLTDLVEAFFDGMAAYLRDLEKHPERAEEIEDTASIWLQRMSKGFLEKALPYLSVDEEDDVRS